MRTVSSSRSVQTTRMRPRVGDNARKVIQANVRKVIHPQRGVEAAIVAFFFPGSFSPSSPQGAGGAVGNAKRFPRGVGGCRGRPGEGAAAFHAPAARRPGGDGGAGGRGGTIST